MARIDQKTLEEIAGVPVADRIALKLEYLQRLMEDGESPHGGWQSFPRELAPYRRLHAPEAKLYYIGSPNAFTTDIDDVAEIDRLLKKIAERYPLRAPPPPKASAADKVKASDAKKVEAEKQLEDVLANWHATDHQLDQERMANANLRLRLSIIEEARAQERRHGDRSAKTRLRVVK